LCPECARKMHLKAKDIPHIGVIYDQFQKEIDAIKDNNEKIIVVPSLDRFATTFLEDIYIDKEIVDDVYDMREFRKEKYFLGKATKVIDDNNIESFDGKTLVILPFIEYEKIIGILKDKAITPKRIVCWNEFFS